MENIQIRTLPNAGIETTRRARFEGASGRRGDEAN
jgi:hypothetical protein